MTITATRIKELLDTLNVGQTELARWLGVRDRTIRHYVKGSRPVPPSLALLLEYLAARPEAKAWFDQNAERLMAENGIDAGDDD